jgi:hypothetical protein
MPKDRETVAMRHPTILVVYDEEDILVLVRFNLPREGYTVLSAASGETAWRTLGETPVGLLVLDLMLPGTDGLALGADDYVTESSACAKSSGSAAAKRAGRDSALPSCTHRTGAWRQSDGGEHPGRGQHFLPSPAPVMQTVPSWPAAPLFT